MTLYPVSRKDIDPFIPDFRERAGEYEPLPDEAVVLGIFEPDLIGYFAIQGYANGNLEILQGYLKPGFRRKRLDLLAMKLLQEKARRAGYKKIGLLASRSLRAYSKFMDSLGFKPEKIAFGKEL
jgi:hypothetical protein